MANYQTVETQKIAATGTDKFATFSQGCQEYYLVADGDCFVDFDEVAQNGQSLLLKANTAPVRFVFGGGNVTEVHAITSGGSVNVYVMGVRGK